MKILHVETGRHFYGGAQQVAYLLRGLAARGVDNVLVCTPGSEIETVARELDCRIRPLACAGDLDVRFSGRLMRMLREERPDLLHCHSRRGADLMGGIAAALARVPAVVSRRVDHREASFLAWLRYRPFRRVVAISQNVAASLVDNGVAPERLAVIRSAVNFAAFQHEVDRAGLRRAFGLGESGPVIAAVGQLIPRKGHRYLLEAAAELRPRLPQLRLVIFGRGRLADNLAEQARQLGLADTVQFAGFRDDLDHYLGGFDLVVHPALREGLGVAMLKASAAGVPVVAFDVAGSREVVVSRKTGILVTPKDTQQLGKAILELLENESLRQQYGAAARARMREEFSIDALVDQHLRLYEAVLHE